MGDVGRGIGSLFEGIGGLIGGRRPPKPPRATAPELAETTEEIDALQAARDKQRARRRPRPRGGTVLTSQRGLGDTAPTQPKTLLGL
jgi:hypothetical protein